ncbi:10723_t:CDS:2, partial [Racocetra persica]
FALRNEVSPNLNLDMMKFLQAELDHINLFVQIFQSARRQVTRNPALKLKISNVFSQDMRNYNLPVASEIAAIITNDNTIDSGRNIILTTQQDALINLLYETESRSSTEGQKSYQNQKSYQKSEALLKQD